MVKALMNRLVKIFKRRDAKSLYAKEREASTSPWAAFEINGFEEDGRIKVDFSWNNSFIKKIKDMGFQAETDEDCVQLFFFTSSMRPVNLAEDPSDDAVQSSSHPNLSSINNQLHV